MDLSKEEKQQINSLIKYYNSKRKDVFETFLNSFVPNLTGNEKLSKIIHSVKWRTKDPKSLRDKLERKILEAKLLNKKININKQNLFNKINDLAGIRILHLYTNQFPQINEILLQIFNDLKFIIIEGPEARVWDDEYRAFFQRLNIKIKNDGNKSSHNKKQTLYSSVHYVLDTKRQIPFTVEVQVRTLADEIWGEVDHQISYPHETRNVACREQIQVLARITSGCTRLVDSIFSTYYKNKK